ncbi:MAG: N-acetylmuramic acid 6-phosphate etherase [Bacteroidota bacterium]
MKEKVTEQDSRYDRLEQMTTEEILHSINAEDQSVPLAVEKAIPRIHEAVDAISERMANGGRMFYLGAGTSGRLGIVDASELPPTYGLEHGRVIGMIAGGDSAIRKAVEFAEDDPDQGWNDLLEKGVSALDCVVGIAASGTTPYVVGAMLHANKQGILTVGITCNPASPLSEAVKIPIEVVVGPEFVTGSTRMKAGTAQKLVLNMISTSVMIKLGRVKGNKMVDMQLTNNKLVDRGTRMIMEALNVSTDEARRLLEEFGSVRKAIDSTRNH